MFPRTGTFVNILLAELVGLTYHKPQVFVLCLGRVHCPGGLQDGSTAGRLQLTKDGHQLSLIHCVLLGLLRP